MSAVVLGRLFRVPEVVVFRDLDLSAFDGSVSADALRAFRREAGAARRYRLARPLAFTSTAAVVVLIVAVILAAVIGGFLSEPNANTVGASVTVAVAILIVAVAVFVGWLEWRRRWTRWYRFERFARDNGFLYSSAIDDPPLPGVIFGLGRDRRATDVVRKVTHPVFEAGSFRYTTGEKKSESTHHWGYLCVRLDRHVPHLVLDARSNDSGFFGIRSSNLPFSFSADQRLSLEGDFDRHFTLYCPTGYERDALYILTPDLMGLLIDESGDFDVEIVDDRLFVYSSTPFAMDDPRTLRRLVRIADTVGAKAVRQTDRYADDAVGDRRIDTVAAPGRRLRVPTLTFGAVVVAVVVVAAALFAVLVGR